MASDKPFFWIAIPILLILYFLPTLIAARKGKKGLTQIFLINLVLGWFIVFWIFILDWARKGETPLENKLMLPFPQPVYQFSESAIYRVTVVSSQDSGTKQAPYNQR